jgi:hypothetical protein
MKHVKRSTILRITALLVAAVLAAGAAPAMASRGAAEDYATFTSVLAEAPATKAAEKLAAKQVRPASVDQAAAKSKIRIEVPRPVATSSSSPVRAQSTAVSSTAPVKASTSSTASSITRARAILAGYVAKYPILKGTTVEFGDARGHQAIALYKSGRIIISPTHTASLERIIGHEIWHIIDWRDNGQINWGESVPPANASSFGG